MNKIASTETIFTCGCVSRRKPTVCKKHGRFSFVEGYKSSKLGKKTILNKGKLRIIKTRNFSRFLEFARDGYDYISLINFKLDSEWKKVISSLVSISKSSCTFMVYCSEEETKKTITFMEKLLPEYRGKSTTLVSTSVPNEKPLFFKGSVLIFSRKNPQPIPKIAYLGSLNMWDRYWITRLKAKQVLEFNATTPRLAYAAQEESVRCLIHTKYMSLLHSIETAGLESLSDMGVYTDSGERCILI
jgi:hypothetical protein